MAEQLDFRQLSIADFLTQAASSEPVPGGGSISAVAGALAASMGQMVLNLTIGKEKYKQFEADCISHLHSLQKAQSILLQLMDEDIAAFAEFSAARKLDKNDPGRAPAMAQAIEACIAVPLEICAVGLAILESLDKVKEKSNIYLLSDLGVGAVLAAAIVKSAAYNVKANLSMVKDDQQVKTLRSQMEHDAKRAHEMLASIENFLATKL